MASVSVVLPTYNRLAFLKPAVRSVFDQTYSDWEMIVADDGSDEETRAYLSSLTAPRVRILWLQHSGNPSHVRNEAINAATGDYLAFLDSDDLWAPTKLERQIDALTTHPQAGWCYTLEQTIDANGHPWDNSPVRTFAPQDGWVFESLLSLQLAMSMPTIVARRSIVTDIRGFDERLLCGEWHDFCLRLALKSEVRAVREPLCFVRAHHAHYSADRLGEHGGWMQLYAKMAALAPRADLRTCCFREYAHASLRLAASMNQRSGYWPALCSLGRALPIAWRFPSWWWGALKRIARPAVPSALFSKPRDG
jgi:glycosyltransferase involved in cell wall biosynthesis